MRWLIVVLALAGGGWFGYSKWMAAPDVKKDALPAVRVSVAPVVRGDVPLAVSLAGNVVAYETVAIKSRIDSQVMEVKFHDGDTVAQGQLLFVLDDRSLKAQISQLEATLKKEQAQLENARVQYERAQKLIEGKFVAQAQLDDAKAAYSAQQAVTRAAQANLDNTRVLLSYAAITAPISGRAGTINVTQGNNVKANDAQPLVTINQVSPIRVQFAIPERYYEAVKTAMAQRVAVRALRAGKQAGAEGTLEYIDNTIDPTTGTFTARARFANEQEALWPGMFVNVGLELGKETGVLTVPAVAIQGDEGKHFVFKIVEGAVIKTPVDVARMAETNAIIRSGVNEGEQVAVDGLLRLSDGAKVEVANADASQPAPQDKP